MTRVTSRLSTTQWIASTWPCLAQSRMPEKRSTKISISTRALNTFKEQSKWQDSCHFQVERVCSEPLTNKLRVISMHNVYVVPVSAITQMASNRWPSYLSGLYNVESSRTLRIIKANRRSKIFPKTFDAKKWCYSTLLIQKLESKLI